MAQMRFTCATEVRDQILIVRGQGYLDDTGGEDLKQVVMSASLAGIKGVVVDFTKCIHANSSGISCLVDLVINLGDDKQLEVGLCGLSPLLAEAFRMVGLTRLARVFSGVDEAMRGLLE